MAPVTRYSLRLFCIPFAAFVLSSHASLAEDEIAEGMTNAACGIMAGAIAAAETEPTCEAMWEAGCAEGSAAIEGAGGGPEDPVADAATAAWETLCAISGAVVCNELSEEDAWNDIPVATK